MVAAHVLLFSIVVLCFLYVSSVLGNWCWLPFIFLLRDQMKRTTKASHKHSLVKNIILFILRSILIITSILLLTHITLSSNNTHAASHRHPCEGAEGHAGRHWRDVPAGQEVGGSVFVALCCFCADAVVVHCAFSRVVLVPRLHLAHSKQQPHKHSQAFTYTSTAPHYFQV